MSAQTRPANAEDVARLWPAVRSARLMRSIDEFARFREAAPWRVRLDDAGEALVLSPWRFHLGTLAIRALWASPSRVPVLVDDVAAVARAQGFGQLLSPLVAISEVEPYLKAGMRPVEDIVALQGAAETIARCRPATVTGLRPGLAAEIPALVELDAECFDEFWRYGSAEMTEAMQRERLVVAEADDAVVGYCVCAVHSATATVGRLAVTPAARRLGIGSALLADAAAFTLRSGADVVSLCTQESNAASRAAYRSCGLVELDERYTLTIRDA